MFPEAVTLNNNEITIQLSLDGFSYSVYDKTRRKYIHLERVNEQDPSLKTAVEKIETTHSCKIDGFGRTIILFDNCPNTFVPASIFRNRAKGKYLDFLGIGGDGRTAASDFLDVAEANNVFSITNDDAATLSEMQGDTQFHHAASVLVSNIIKTNIHHNEPVIHINMKSPQFDVIVTKGCNLLFHNVFNFKTKEDFLYFLLFTIDQLHLDAGTVPVYFLGLIEEKSQLVELASRYIRDIRFVRRDNDMTFTEEIEKTPYFHNYLLFNSITCEL
ncbi:MAG: DUF3822 family protein [Bacteroidia bacterium]|nr:DUF3822 family protein [Bacteroidia bacterium]